jgi:glucose-6-phosphate 1-dehydrogenase
MAADGVDALVIFGATGGLAKLETFPALVGLVQRGVLDVPIVGVAKSGWRLGQFRDYAAASLKLNNMDPASPAATKMLGLYHGKRARRCVRCARFSAHAVHVSGGAGRRAGRR